MTPSTITGWILFAIMWVAGPITGYTACCLIASAWERKTVERREVVTIVPFGGLMAISTSLLMLVDWL